MFKRWCAAAMLVVAAAIPAFAQQQPPAAPAEPFPMRVFAQLPETERPRISTDGSAIAAKIRHNGEQMLAVIPLDVPDPRPIVVARDGEFDRTNDFEPPTGPGSTAKTSSSG